VVARTVLDGVGSRLASKIPRTRSWLATAAAEVDTLDLELPAGTVVAHDGENLALGEPTSSGGGAPSGGDGVRVRLALRPGALRVYAPAEQRPDQES
jgi:hypothetical protein